MTANAPINAPLTTGVTQAAADVLQASIRATERTDVIVFCQWVANTKMLYVDAAEKPFDGMAPRLPLFAPNDNDYGAVAVYLDGEPDRVMAILGDLRSRIEQLIEAGAPA